MSDIVVRFLMDVPTEEPTYVYVSFDDEEQAAAAMTALTSADGLVSIQNASGIPALLDASKVVAGYPVEFAEYEYEYEYENDEEEDEDEEE